jgi:DNA-binding winged helix-turn-helix (wHTH) protein/tetratricopeptide (TPR) repeat protein
LPKGERALSIYAFGPFKLDAENCSLSVGATSLANGSKVVETLLALVERAGQTCTAQQLLERIWPEGYVEPAILPQNIYVLRKMMSAHWNATVIETVRRRGYRFLAPVSLIEPADAAAHAAMAPVTPWSRANRAWRWSALAACVLLVIATLRYSVGPVRGTATGLSTQSTRLYAIGRFYWDSRTRAGVLKSIKYFQRIVHSEPRNALGYSGLADAYYILADYDYGPRSPQTYRAWERSNVEKALALDPNLSEVHASRAMLLGNVDHDLASAQREFAVAIELDPKNAAAHYWFGIMLLEEGKTERARAEFESAEQLDPTSPAINRWLAMVNYMTRRYRPAIAYYLQALDLKPDDAGAATMLGLAYEQLHAYDAALRTFQHFERLCKCAAPLVMEARTLALMGRHAEARIQLAHAKTAVHKQDIEPIDMAAAFIALGDRDQAMKWLRSFAHSDYFAGTWLHLDPRLDAVRGDPYFSSFFSSHTSCALAC